MISEPNTANAVEMRNITVKYPETLANDNVSISVKHGEVYALIGENGAGKSTLMNVLYGLVKPLGGTIMINGTSVANHSSANSIRLGVGMVHQHFMLVDSFTVAQNVVLGHEPTRGGVFLNEKRAVEITQQLILEYGLCVDPNAVVRDLGVGMQQRVEILKTLSRGSQILILDEPTAVLTPRETDELFSVIRRLVEKKGYTVIIITHKLHEVMQVSDRVAVMRRGKLVGVHNTSDVNQRMLASMMIGREVLFDAMEKSKVIGDEVLGVYNLTVNNIFGQAAVNDISFCVHAGEIVGIAGVEGNGQSELVEALSGLKKMVAGTVSIGNQIINNLAPNKIRTLGLSHIPEDRLKTGLSENDSIEDNLIAGKQRRKEFCCASTLLRSALTRYAAKLLKEYDVRTESVKLPIKSLSGGNMQKVVIAREFSFEGAKVLLVAQPTRGVDVGAMESIHKLIAKKRDEGCAILLISADLDEILRLSDRIFTMFEGKITDEFAACDATKENVGQAMLMAKDIQSVNNGGEES